MVIVISSHYTKKVSKRCYACCCSFGNLIVHKYIISQKYAIEYRIFSIALKAPVLQIYHIEGYSLLKFYKSERWFIYYSDVIISVMASRITGISIVCSADYSGTDQRKHQKSASLVFVRRTTGDWLLPVTRKIFPLDDVIRITTDKIGA